MSGGGGSTCIGRGNEDETCWERAGDETPERGVGGCAQAPGKGHDGLHGAHHELGLLRGAGVDHGWGLEFATLTEKMPQILSPLPPVL